MSEKGKGGYTSSKSYKGESVSLENYRSDPIPRCCRDADKTYELVIEEIKALKIIKYVPQQCNLCGVNKEEDHLSRVKSKGEERLNLY